MSSVTPVKAVAVKAVAVKVSPVNAVNAVKLVVVELVKETPVKETPVEKTSVEKTPVEEKTSVEKTSVEETPVEEKTSVEKTPVKETPVKETPVEKTSVEKTPVEETPVEEKTSVEETPVVEAVVPEFIVVVPYRDRPNHRAVFMQMMPYILEGKRYEIVFTHQCDTRPFNRGAMKNTGFLYLKKFYPNDYKNITIVFNDVDVMPWYKDQFDYKTVPGEVKHFFGFGWALGGIIAINAGDFERINGFPNIWTWGLEDNILEKRCIRAGIKINRENMVLFDNENKNIINLQHGEVRLLSDYIGPKYGLDAGVDGINSLYNMNLDVVKITNNIVEVKVKSFETGESLNSPFVKSAQLTDMSKRPPVTFNAKMRLKSNTLRRRTLMFK